MWVAQHNALHDKLTKWGKDLILSLCECCAVFSHLVQENLLQKIAASDEYEVVRQVQESYACKSDGRSAPWCALPYTSQELYASFVPVDPSLFSLEFSFGMNYSPSDVRKIPRAFQTIYFWRMIQCVLREQKSLRATDRVVEGISLLLLSLKWKPAIRFQRRYAWFYHNSEILVYDTSCPLDVAPFMHYSSSRCRRVAEEIHRLAYIQVLRTIV